MASTNIYDHRSSKYTLPDETFVILVDEGDNEIGIMEKMEAHRKALLHRAVSVFIINSQGDWVLQRRAFSKYHSNGLWTNTCCSHPNPGESSLDAANRRLTEEMGIACPLKEIFTFIYKEPLDNELTEYELDHIFIGISDELPQLNKDEVMECKVLSYSEISKEMISSPDLYTVWFRKLFERVGKYVADNY